MTDEEMTGLAINTIRTLSIDAVQQAKSGHPGTPMALAPLIYAIWNRVMRFDPEGPVEQASTFGWERYVGRRGCVVGMKTFGASAPLKELQRKFGFEPDQVVTVAKDLLVRNQPSLAPAAA